MGKTIKLTSPQKSFSIHEDWAVVVLGFLIIGIFILGLIVPAPSYSWSNSEELFEKVFASKNLLSIGAQFMLC